MSKAQDNTYICWFENLDSDDVPVVGGKNASLGEMLQTLEEAGIRVPDGFATTADAYREFLQANEIEEKMRSLLDDLRNESKSLQEVGKGIRRLFYQAEFPKELEEAIRDAYRQLSEMKIVTTRACHFDLPPQGGEKSLKWYFS